MKRNTWKLVILLGILMILSAVMLCVYNYREDQDAEAFSQNIMEMLKKEIPDPSPQKPEEDSTVLPEDDLFAAYEQQEPEDTAKPSDIVIGQDAYCGFLSIPALELELPVMSDWSYPDLKRSPCRYSGSVQTHDLIIAAHNYPAHFGRLIELQTGDLIRFTDTSGQTYDYAVAFTEYIAGTDVEQMFFGQSEDWELTLYTCTLSGQSRVTIRAALQQEENTEESA